MPWLQISIETDASRAETLSDALSEIGAVAVTYQDAADEPVYEPALNTTPLWGKTRVIGLFMDTAEEATVLNELTAMLDPEPLPLYIMEWVEDQEWTRVWMEDYHPIAFGKRLWICPSWETPPDPDAINIMLDPGLAFGTGTHPTTALCLEWLDQQTDLAGKHLIDYGCGSGILAIAALKLGAASVLGIDNDPQALIASLDNAKNNAVDAALTLGMPKDLPEDFLADGMLANILALPLIELAPLFAKYLKAGAPIVLSGILQEQTDMVCEAYKPYFTMIEISSRDQWMRIVAQRTAA
ncbi:MAG: hypothetical protein RIS84_919 [Pseudomonadota bacterium]